MTEPREDEDEGWELPDEIEIKDEDGTTVTVDVD